MGKAALGRVALLRGGKLRPREGGEHEKEIPFSDDSETHEVRGLLDELLAHAFLRGLRDLPPVVTFGSNSDALTRGPAHVAAAEDVDVEVFDGLAAVGAGVDDEAVAVPEALGLGDLTGGGEEGAEKAGVLG